MNFGRGEGRGGYWARTGWRIPVSQKGEKRRFADRRALPYREYGRLTEVDHDAVLEHKRLSHAPKVS